MIVDMLETPEQAYVRRCHVRYQTLSTWEPEPGQCVDLDPARLLEPHGRIIGVARFGGGEPRYLVDAAGQRAIFTLTELRLAAMGWILHVPLKVCA